MYFGLLFHSFIADLHFKGSLSKKKTHCVVHNLSLPLSGDRELTYKFYFADPVYPIKSVWTCVFQGIGGLQIPIVLQGFQNSGDLWEILSLN